MKFSAILLGAALYLVSSIEAGITTNTPFKSITWNGGENVKVIWDDDGKAPKLADIGVTSVDLMAGDATKQFFVANIAKVPATAKVAPFTVPKSVGPPGNFYFIKYTAAAGTENYTAFSGMFSIAKVNGKITGFDPKSLAGDAKVVDPAKTSATPTTAKTSSPPKTGDAKDVKAPSASGATSPIASPTVGSVANNAANLFPSFAGVSTVAVGLALTYLY